MDAAGGRPGGHRRHRPGRGSPAGAAHGLSTAGRTAREEHRVSRYTAPGGTEEGATATRTQQTERDTSPPPLQTDGGSGRRKGRILRFIGGSFLAAGFVLATYLAWVLWGTGLYAVEAQGDLRSGLEQQIQEIEDHGAGPRPGRILQGDAYALLRIPAIGVNAAVVQGTDVEGLKQGPGHYIETADPWDRRGTVGIAGHRTTYGAWFWDLNKLRRGDSIRLLTARGTFDYVVDRLAVVGPGAHEVLDFTPRPTLVLTTCEPRFSAAQRLIAFAHRVELEPGASPDPGLDGGQDGGILTTPQGPTELVVAIGVGGAVVALLLGTGTAVRRRRERRAQPQAMG